MQRGFFDRGVRQVAEDLLGAVIEHRTQPGLVAIRLTEVEAYDGPNDPGSHAYRGRTQRNAVMFGPPGHVYVYFTYGMHWCMNLVCGPDGRAGAVLLRAGEVIEGHHLAWSRRQAAKRERDLARGPARLTSALGVDRSCDGADACAESSALRVRDGGSPGSRGSVGPGASGASGTAATGVTIGRGPRVGLSAAAERPWRYWVDGDPTVSVYRPHTPKKRTGGRGPANDRKASS